MLEMNRRVLRLAKTPVVVVLGVATLGMLVVLAAPISTLWGLAGQNSANTRSQSGETKIGVANVATLAPKWQLDTDGDISATPAVDGQNVYVPDWAGLLHAVNRTTGQVVWTRKVVDYTGVAPRDQSGFGAGGVVRTTPAVVGNLLIMGDQGGRRGEGAKVFAVDRRTGDLVWLTQLQGNGADGDPRPGAQFAIVTQSPVVDENNPTVVYVGTASWEEALSAFIPGYPCCSFRGLVAALDVRTGQVLWRTYMVPSLAGYSGNGVWGNTAAIDGPRKTLYVTTGNNYSVPPSVGACIENAGTDAAKLACMDANNHFDSIVALDMQTGAVKWATRALPFDTWNVNCLGLEGIGDPANCPSPAGPDYDFGQGPILFSAKVGGKTRDLVGAGQKSGTFWAVDRLTGGVVWRTDVGPGGTMGGLQWGSAIDDKRIYMAVNNSGGASWTPRGSLAPTTKGAWSALDKATGEILWQRETTTSMAFPGLGSVVGPVTVANGVVYGCSFTGTYTAMNAATGAVLWTHESQNACAAGAAVSQGVVYWGTGYGQIMFGPLGPGRLTAFTTP